MSKIRFLITYLFLFILVSSCHHNGSDPDALFQVLDNKSTGIDFTNTLHPTEDFNVLKYMYFYNGGGVGAGDFNNDGKIDLFFASNQEKNKLYLNEGNLKFKDVTEEAKIPNDGGWSTGVSVVDINNDGLLDIYICRVGNHEILHSHNQLLICQGIDKNGVPYYKDEAKEYGLDFSGFSTQALFFDYDMDGDLDMYLLNHSIHQNRTFGARDAKLVTFNPLSGDRLYRNDGGKKFTDVTQSSNIHSSVIGYGLGIVAADINLDGYPDLYVGNDFHENDYLYINQKNGTFRDETQEHIMHTSQYTMGVDVGDINNDGYPEIVTMDMLPSDPVILKRSLGEDEVDIFNLKIGYGYNHQYTRNNLQFNRRNGMFSEIGLYSDVYATDWSWSPLWVDFDNDGSRDLFVSNGIPKRLNDIDYMDFISNQEIQEKLHNTNDDKPSELISHYPEIKLANKFFKNDSALKFTDLKAAISGDRPTFSNGAVVADFDNDGDEDIVVNNIDDPALLYQNKTNDGHPKAYVDFQLKGSSQNINAIGSKVVLFANGGIRVYEKFPVRGFMSSMETPLHIGLEKTKIDSMFLIWPDNSFQRIHLDSINRVITYQYQQGLPKFDYSIITSHWPNPLRPMKDISAEVNLQFRHKENEFPEFDREPLIP
ncbi:MAG TPA: CRTAC1 family protein, partial [Puia sp.]|nr:CRTAC1 family protein [Puia sp.]